MKINNKEYEFLNFSKLLPSEKSLVLEWRNHDNIRRWMYNQEIVSLEDHLSFINKLPDDNTKCYFMVKRDGIPIGVFSIINIYNGSGEWGYYLAPDLHNKSLSVEFYYAVLTFCFEYIRLEQLIGYALESNKSANSLNTLFGFTSELIIKEKLSEKYFKRILTIHVWYNTIKNNDKILRLLEITK